MQAESGQTAEFPGNRKRAASCTSGCCAIRQYEVVVGNLGTVYFGGSPMLAAADYRDYVLQSKAGYGRVAYEPVTILRDGAPWMEYTPEPRPDVGAV